MSESRIVTIKEYIDAMEKNGWPQARYALWRGKNMLITDDRGYQQWGEIEISEACAMGQALLNLNGGKKPKNYRGVGKLRITTATISHNDNYGWDIPTIVKYLRKKYAGKEDEPAIKIWS